MRLLSVRAVGICAALSAVSTPASAQGDIGPIVRATVAHAIRIVRDQNALTDRDAKELPAARRAGLSRQLPVLVRATIGGKNSDPILVTPGMKAQLRTIGADASSKEVAMACQRRCKLNGAAGFMEIDMVSQTANAAVLTVNLYLPNPIDTRPTYQMTYRYKLRLVDGHWAVGSAVLTRRS